AEGPVTSYLVIDTPGGIFDGSNASRFSEVADGTSNTVLVVEDTQTNVRWNEPRDVTLGVGLPVTSYHPTGGNVAMADGAVHFISNLIDVPTFMKMVTKNGNDFVEIP
ncbi:MAG: DUF1559 domain-containing protein, partial [bacterium]|nr:DUF1559 domain-containing protein [bacterium]